MEKIVAELIELYGAVGGRAEKEPESSREAEKIAALSGEAELQLHRAISELPPRMRDYVWLRLENLGYQEIARRMSRSPQTVRTQLFMARRRLRRKLGIAEDLGTRASPK